MQASHASRFHENETTAHKTFHPAKRTGSPVRFFMILFLFCIDSFFTLCYNSHNTFT